MARSRGAGSSVKPHKPRSVRGFKDNPILKVALTLSPATPTPGQTWAGPPGVLAPCEHRGTWGPLGRGCGPPRGRLSSSPRAWESRRPWEAVPSTGAATAAPKGPAQSLAQEASSNTWPSVGQQSSVGRRPPPPVARELHANVSISDNGDTLCWHRGGQPGVLTHGRRGRESPLSQSFRKGV